MALIEELASPYYLIHWKHPEFGEERTVIYNPRNVSLDQYSTIIKRLTEPEVLAVLRAAAKEEKL